MKHPSAVRERVEEIERASLSTWATLASETKGRDHYEEPDPVRTAFQLDRDRLCGTDAFQRLAGKTHAFIPDGVGAGWRSRLGHTLAAVGVSRTLARSLRLNEDLAEAVSAGHHLGSPPLGQAGFDVLDDVLGRPFAPAEQSLRIVEELEPRLNLTWEVRDGILHQDPSRPASTPEGTVAALGCRLATALFDFRACLRAGLVQVDDLPPVVRSVLGTKHDQRVSAVVADAASVSMDRPEVGLSDDAEAALQALEAFLAAEAHSRSDARAEHDLALHCLRSLAIYADANGPPGTADEAGGIVDWLCGATDRELIDRFDSTFRPSRTAQP